MMLRPLAVAALLVLPMAAVRAQQGANEVRVLEATPAANAHIGRKSSAFFVRFDRPVDHRKSTLVIKQGDKVIERLHPHWAVITLQGTKAIEGDIPFKVSDRASQ